MFGFLMQGFAPWGLLPVAVVLAVVLGARVGAIAAPRSSPSERALLGCVGAIALVVAWVRVLGMVGGLSSVTLLAGLVGATMIACRRSRHRKLGLVWGGIVTRETVAIAAVAGVAVVLAGGAAFLLPIWQWDSLGYHLPYVNFALVGGGFSSVPSDMPYVATYPHVVESFFIAWRAMLPDDRLVDAAQIPFGLLGALAVGVLARQAGAERAHAAAAGMLWLAAPAVFLQLPTNYIDVAAGALLLAAAAFTLAEPKPAHVMGAGVALGLFLGSKANAPLGVAALFAVLAVRAYRAGCRRSILAAAAVTLLLGGESYFVNLVRYGNPVFPVEISLGPIQLPGTVSMKTLLASGCGAPRVMGSLPVRLLRSWTALQAPPMYDMRYGGFGVAFLMALPACVAVLVRRRSLVIAIVMVATLASPDPAIARYVFAFPGIVLAMGASLWSTTTSSWIRHGIGAAAAVGAAIGLYRAYPALAGDGPPLAAYVQMNAAERLRAVGADGSPARYHDALARLEPGKTTAFDSSLDLPYLAWRSDLSTRAIRISDSVSEAGAARLLANPSVGLLIVGEGSPVAKAAREASSTFVELFRAKKNIPLCAVAVAAAAGATAGTGEQLLDILNMRWPSTVVYLRTTSP